MAAAAAMAERKMAAAVRDGGALPTCRTEECHKKQALLRFQSDEIKTRLQVL